MGPQLGPDGTCRLCRMPPPGIEVLQLPAHFQEIFADLPWSKDPVRRFMEKLLLFKAIGERDAEAAEHAITMLYQRNTEGGQPRT